MVDKEKKSKIDEAVADEEFTALTGVDVPEADTPEADAPEPAGRFTTQVGKNNYEVNVFFNQKTKATYADRAKKLIWADVKAGRV